MVTPHPSSSPCGRPYVLHPTSHYNTLLQSTTHVHYYIAGLVPSLALAVVRSLLHCVTRLSHWIPSYSALPTAHYTLRTAHPPFGSPHALQVLNEEGLAQCHEYMSCLVCVASSLSLVLSAMLSALCNLLLCILAVSVALLCILAVSVAKYQ